MGEVIHVDFSKKTNNNVTNVTDDSEDLLQYLQSLRDMNVDEDDVLEVHEAINDMNVFMESDHDIQVFARKYLERYM